MLSFKLLDIAVKCIICYAFVPRTIYYSRRYNLLPSPELGPESGAKPKKKRKERSKEEKFPEANTYNHLESYQEKNYLPADTGADAMDQDLHVGKETVRGPSNKM